MCIDIVEIWFGITNGQISSICDTIIWRPHVCIFISEGNLMNISMDFHQAWYVYWYCRDVFGIADQQIFTFLLQPRFEKLGLYWIFHVLPWFRDCKIKMHFA